MWKDYFYFTHKERRAIWTFTILIVLIQGLTWTSDYWLSYLKETPTPALTQKSKHHKDSSIIIPPKVILNKNIHTQLRADKKFQNPKHSLRIKKTTNIQENKEIAHTSQKHIDIIKNNVYKKRTYLTGTIEINQADTTSLNKIKWVGNNTSTRIIKFRNLLGGYYSKSQIKEIYGLHPEQIQSIKQHITIDKTKIKKIYIQYASIEKLKTHPYINFYQAKAIVENRKKATLDSILNMKEFTTKDKERISNYLTEEKNNLSLK